MRQVRLQTARGGGGGLISKLHLTFATPRTGAHQALLSMGFSRQEYWGGLPFPSPGIETRSPALQADSSPTEPPGKPAESTWGGAILEGGEGRTSPTSVGDENTVKVRALKLPGGREGPVAGEDPPLPVLAGGRKTTCLERTAEVKARDHFLRLMGSHWRAWGRAVVLSVYFLKG